MLRDSEAINPWLRFEIGLQRWLLGDLVLWIFVTVATVLLLLSFP
jgi:hypothetical protein